MGGARAAHFSADHFLTAAIISLSLPSFLCRSEVFCDSQRNILKENDIVRFPKLAITYQRIAEEGPDVFYNGSMAQSIVEDIRAAGLLLFFISC